MNKKPKFINKDGTLTTYSFALGYVETYVNKDSENKSESRAVIVRGVNAFYVKCFVDGTLISQGFKRIKDARKTARRYGKLIRPVKIVGTFF
jgi:disulfide oxidoreductase YuzD